MEVEKHSHRKKITIAVVAFLVPLCGIIVFSELNIHQIPIGNEPYPAALQLPSGELRWLDNLLCRIWTKSCDKIAEEAGRSAKIAEEIFYNSLFSDPGFYPTNLTDLITRCPSLNDFADVTFTFAPSDSSGYTITTQHARSTRTFVFTSW
ncbi:MAG: hypothetical protein H6684_03635 [Deltaproteobacteria bacterium]|nr:hypothetical protein [bacterium]MCB9487804.1 hypothetical protein [Deltaproteobacteria bacterium]